MTADTVRLSYAPGDDHVADALDTPSFRSYLRSAHCGRVEQGTEWSEFVSGGCGATSDVTLRVEAITGGSSIGSDTVFVFEPRPESAPTGLSA